MKILDSLMTKRRAGVISSPLLSSSPSMKVDAPLPQRTVEISGEVVAAVSEVEEDIVSTVTGGEGRNRREYCWLCHETN